MRQLTQELRQLGIQKGVEINSPAVALMHRDNKQEKLETIVQLENDHLALTRCGGMTHTTVTDLPPRRKRKMKYSVTSCEKSH